MRTHMLALMLSATTAVSAAAPNPALLHSAFIYTNAPFPSAHASTLTHTPAGLVTAWFGGTDEGHRDVAIWISRHTNNHWSPPEMVADGVQPDRTTRHPCWNPVLFTASPTNLLLFYKVGPSPSTWWGMLTRSADNGRSWSTPIRLPNGILGPVRCKPISLADGSLLCGSSSEHDGWRLHMERTPDLGITWEQSPALHDRALASLIQPTLLLWPDGRLQLLCRSREQHVYSSTMGSNWKSWSTPAPIDLPNPSSGLDAVILRDGRALLIYNHTSKGRTPLNLATSTNGTNWTPALTLESEPGEFSYPAIIQAPDGLVHLTYTWNRQRIKYATVDPNRL